MQHWWDHARWSLSVFEASFDEFSYKNFATSPKSRNETVYKKTESTSIKSCNITISTCHALLCKKFISSLFANCIQTRKTYSLHGAFNLVASKQQLRRRKILLIFRTKLLDFFNEIAWNWNIVANFTSASLEIYVHQIIFHFKKKLEK